MLSAGRHGRTALSSTRGRDVSLLLVMILHVAFLELLFSRVLSLISYHNQHVCCLNRGNSLLGATGMGVAHFAYEEGGFPSRILELFITGSL